ncbi:MAG: peptidoglycan-associated lipoprotein Pal [Desulfobacterales bacterium]|nr:peptidoglycan-associated lipoprotein Pal [Desulfobacterales bacterium]MDX2511326.1 peptidoglycan-associated lipoprotein Pal [Desulfobacterales bacterium]
MRKKLWIFTGLLLIVPGLLFTVSCAKKVVQSVPVEAPAAVVEEPVLDEAALAAQEQAAQEDAARQWQMQAEEDLQQTQLAEQAAKEAEMERAEMAAMQMFMNEDVYFDFDSSALGDMAKNVLSRKAEWLRMTMDASVIVEGHCDERGTSAYNIALGDRRAESAKTFLLDLGIDANQLSTISYGEERPVDMGKSEESWAKNRRAHFVVE